MKKILVIVLVMMMIMMTACGKRKKEKKVGNPYRADRRVKPMIPLRSRT